jgi:hypothetical protein
MTANVPFNVVPTMIEASVVSQKYLSRSLAIEVHVLQLRPLYYSRLHVIITLKFVAVKIWYPATTISFLL